MDDDVIVRRRPENPRRKRASAETRKLASGEVAARSMSAFGYSAGVQSAGRAMPDKAAQEDDPVKELLRKRRLL